MRTIWLAIVAIVVSTFTLSAQQNRTGSVEILEVEQDGDILTFKVEGIAAKKADVIISAKETLFYRLLYEGVEGVNDDNKLIEHENKYWLDNFFKGKNAPYNAYVRSIEQDGAIAKSGSEFVGSYYIVLNFKALLKALEANGPIDREKVLAKVPPKVNKQVGLAARKEKEEAEARAKAEAEAKAKAEAEAKAREEAEAKARASASTSAGLVFSKNGIGPLKAGAGMMKSGNLTIPDTYNGFYDRVIWDNNQFTGELEISCYDSNGVVLEIACDDENKVKAFAVYTPTCNTAEGLSTSSTAAEILAAGGVEKNNKMVEGSWTTWEYRMYLNGVWFIFKDNVAGSNGKINPSAKPFALSSINYTFMMLDSMK